jgi:uroporphyrinogen-III synthase
MKATPIADFQNLTVVAFENRKGKEIATLIANQHGVPLVAPAMREVPLEENPAAFAFAEELLAGRLDAVIFMTGVGTRTLMEVLKTRYPQETIVRALSQLLAVPRGPKPVAVLRELRVPIGAMVPEPNTWREVLTTLDQQPQGFLLENRRVAVQEYGVTNAAFLDELRKRGAQVVRVPVYRWALPVDVAPLRKALRSLVEGGAQVVLFTNAMQVESLLQIASEENLQERLLRAFEHCVVGSVGPTCSEALAAHHIRVDVEPEHPKMGVLVHEAAQRASGLLADRRRRQE